MRKRAIGQIIVCSILAVVLSLVLLGSLAFARIRQFDSPMDGTLSGFIQNDPLIQKTVEITEKAVSGLPGFRLQFFGCVPTVTLKDTDLNAGNLLDGSRQMGNAIISDPITALSIDWASGAIQIGTHAESSGIYIAEYEGTVDPEWNLPLPDSDVPTSRRLTWKVSGTKLSIDEFLPSISSVGIHAADAKTLIVLLPAGELNKISIDSAATDITLDGISVSELDLDLAAGKLTVYDSTMDTVDIDSAATSGEFSASRIKELDLDSATGSFSFELLETPWRVDLDAMSGSFRFTLPKDASFTVRTDSLSASVSMPGFSPRLEGNRMVVNEGTGSFQFDLVSGSVVIEPAYCESEGASF